MLAKKLFRNIKNILKYDKQHDKSCSNLIKDYYTLHASNFIHHKWRERKWYKSHKKIKIKKLNQMDENIDDAT